MGAAESSMIVWMFVLGCCPGLPDGFLPVGVWGGDPDPTSLTMNVDGTGSLDLACTGGASVGTVDVVAGVVSATFSFDPDAWGPDTQEEFEPFDVVLEGTVCGKRLDATATADDPEFGFTQELGLGLGRDRGFEVPCAQ